MSLKSFPQIFLFPSLVLAVIMGTGCNGVSRSEMEEQLRAIQNEQQQLSAQFQLTQENLQQLDQILEGVSALREENERLLTQLDALQQDFDQFSNRVQTSMVQRLPATSAYPRFGARTPAQQAPSAAPPPSAGNNSDEEKEVVAAYWLTLPAGVRHNQGCPYFKRTPGRIGSATEGVACRVCGG